MKATFRSKGRSHQCELDDDFAAVLLKVEAPDAYPLAIIESHFPGRSKGRPSSVSSLAGGAALLIPVPAFLISGIHAQASLFGSTNWVQGFLDLLTKGKCRRILRRLWRISIKIGRTTVRIGRIIVRVFLTLLDEFPATTAFIVLMALLSFFIHTIPVIGPFLASILLVPAAITGAVLLLFEVWMKLKTWGEFERRLLSALR
jgi:hypothetical protein